MRSWHALVIGGLTGCQLISGIADYDAATGPGGGVGGEGATTSCADDCVEIPPGWSGPFVYSFAQMPVDQLPECPSQLSSSSTVYSNDGQPLPPADCECACSPPLPQLVCGTNLSVETEFDGTTCGTTENATVGACTTIDNGGTGGNYAAIWQQPIPVAAMCTPGDHVDFVPPLPKLRRCGGLEPGRCAEGLHCLGSVGDSFRGWCIEQEGDVECPEGFPAKSLLAANVADDRDCAPCNCGEYLAMACTGTLQRHTTAMCNDLGTGIDPGACAIALGNPVYLSWTPSAVGACNESGGTPIGSAIREDPVTSCCRDE